MNKKEEELQKAERELNNFEREHIKPFMHFLREYDKWLKLKKAAKKQDINYIKEPSTAQDCEAFKEQNIDASTKSISIKPSKEQPTKVSITIEDKLKLVIEC